MEEIENLTKVGAEVAPGVPVETAEEKEVGNVWNERVASLMERYPVSRNLTTEISEYLSEHKELIEKENCLETALLNVLSSKASAENKSSDVFRALKQSAPKLIEGGSHFVTAPTYKASSIKEANQFAASYLKQKNR